MIDKATLGEQVEDALRKEILSGHLEPGQKIDLNEYATTWGVSSTPMRDAVSRLEQIGFVTVLPRRGVYVASIDQTTFKETFELRIALECMAVELSTPVIPTEEIEHVLQEYRDAERYFQGTGSRSRLIEVDYLVHQTVLHYCGNTRIIQIMHGLQDLINWARKTIVAHLPAAYEVTFPEHIEIVEAILARDVDRAVNAMRRHLENSYERTRSYWEQIEDQGNGSGN